MMRLTISQAYEAVFAEVNDLLGAARLHTKTPVPSQDDRGRFDFLSTAWFPGGKNRGFRVDDHGRYAIVRAWAHDGPICDIELVCRNEPDEDLIRWAARAVGLLPGKAELR